MEPYAVLPKDQEGYTTSFSLTDYDRVAVEQFYHTYGLLVFRNVISSQQVDHTVDALWETAKEVAGQDVDRHNPNTWHFKSLLQNYGFVDHTPLYHPQFWKNRQHPNVYECFKLAYQAQTKSPLKEPLLAMFDRGSLMRPSKHHPEWKTKHIYHFDLNPWIWTGEFTVERKYWRNSSEYHLAKFERWLGEGNYTPNVGYTKFAGVLALSNTNQHSGGFEAVCGFQNRIKDWCHKHQKGTPVESDLELMKSFQKVFLRSGSLLIFSRELPHNIYANLSEQFRYAQYLRMSPESAFLFQGNQRQMRRNCLKKMIPAQLEVTAISREIFMLDA